MLALPFKLLVCDNVNYISTETNLKSLSFRLAQFPRLLGLVFNNDGGLAELRVQSLTET